MDRAVRFSLFALGTFIGALFVTFALEWTGETAEEPVLAQGGQQPDGLAGRNADVGAELVLPRAATPDPGHDELDLEAMEARDRDVGQRRATLIRERADQEDMDPNWAPAMQRHIAEQFAAQGPAGAKLVSATCKTSLCIAEIESLSSRDSTGQMGWAAMFGLGRGFVMNHETAIDGQYRSVVYLARDGHSLPK